jgi:hypothetical protein
MKTTLAKISIILFLLVLSAGAEAEPFDPWKADPQAMATFIWTQHGDPPLSNQQQDLLRNSIENDFKNAGEYYPEPAQLAEFFLNWYAFAYPGDKNELRESIIAWESIEVSQADMGRALERDIRDYVRRAADCPACPRDLLRERLIQICDNPTEDGPCQRGCTPYCERLKPEGGGPSYEILNRREIERRYYDQIHDRKRNLQRMERRVRQARFKERHPDLHTPSWLTANTIVKGREDGTWKKMKEKHVRSYDYDRDKVYAGVIMENVIKGMSGSSR